MPGAPSEEMWFQMVAAHAAAAQSDVTSTGVDMQANGAWDAISFLVNYGTPAADNLFHAEGSANNSDWSDIAGSEIDLSGASDESQWLTIVNPPRRYVRVVAQRGTSSTTCAIWAVATRGKVLSGQTMNLVSGTIYGKTLINPAIGTK